MNQSELKIKNRFTKMDHVQLFEVLRKLNTSDTEEAFILFDIGLEIYEKKVPEETFLQALKILDKDLDFK